MVEAAGKAGMIGFFGAGGLTIQQIDSAIDVIQKRLGERPYGFNLIYSPSDMDLNKKPWIFTWPKELVWYRHPHTWI